MSEVRALLLTDVVDSTSLSESLGDEEIADLWAAHDRVARDLMQQTQGREIDKTDGMLVMFDTAADATDDGIAEMLRVLTTATDDLAGGAPRVSSGDSGHLALAGDE